MFIDKVQIKMKAGDGGDGIVSFHREKFVDMGGPDGGDGGRGGSIFFVATTEKNTLIDFYHKKKFYAQNGERGMKKKCSGKAGEDLVILVPAGTVVKEAETQKVLCDLHKPDQKIKLLSGGKGGFGNVHFATSTRQAPTFSLLGEKTKEYDIVLELKTIADVGLLGFPNVGKSTLLSVVSEAKPKIANYHFTTLSPNLGVVRFHDQSFVMADIPGIIEGASEGVGLGLEFLRHVERTRLLVHVVDASGIEGRDPYHDFVLLNEELKKYSQKLANLPQIVALNKADITADIAAVEKQFKKKLGANIVVVPISGATKSGIQKLLDEVVKTLKTLPQPEVFKTEIEKLDERDETTLNITRDDAGRFIVTGGYVDRLSRGIVLSEPESFAFFQRRIKEDGILDALYQKGAKEGDTVVFGGVEFDMID